MRKTRPLALLALFLCAMMLLVSCSGAGGNGNTVKSLPFKKVVKQSAAEEPATAQFEKLTLEGTVTQMNYPFVVLAKDDNQVVYNIEQNKVVFSNTNTESLTAAVTPYAPDGRTAYFCVRITDNRGLVPVFQSVLYDASGNQIAAVDRVENPARNFDLVSFGGKVYRLGDTSATATLTELTGYSAISGNIPAIDAATSDYYYVFNAARTNVSVYDKNLKLLWYYAVEGAPADCTSMILNNGNVVFQTHDLLPAAAEDYTYFDGTDKYLMKTVVVNAKSGKAAEVSCNYVLTFGISADVDRGAGIDEDNWMFAKKIRSVGIFCPISDRILRNGLNDRMLVAVKDDFGFIGRLDAMIDNQAPASVINEIYPGYFTANLVNGGTVLFDGKGKEIGNISGADDLTYSYIFADGKLFGYDLKEIFDYETADYDVENVFEHSVILSKDNDGVTEYFIYTDKVLTPLDTKDDKLTYGYVGDGIYSITDSTNLLTPTIRYYNDKGEQILALDTPIVLARVTGGTNAALYSGVDPATTQSVYYRVTY